MDENDILNNDYFENIIDKITINTGCIKKDCANSGMLCNTCSTGMSNYEPFNENK